MLTPTRPFIDPEQAAMLTSGVAIHVGIGVPGKMPDAVNAIGCSIEPGRRAVTLLVARNTAARLLQDLQHSGLVAAVFSEMETHRTIQLKGRDARIEATSAAHLACAAAYANSYLERLASLGFARKSMAALIACRAEDIIAIAFTPSEAYTQTPGPAAGEPLQAGA
jgi:hypothetical protein